MAKPRLWKKKIEIVGEGVEFEGVPLFESSGELGYISVTREDPEEGFLGKLTPNATEQDIRKKYGGGTFTLSAREPGGKPAKNGHRIITIAGDPVFQSRAAEEKWKRAQGLGSENQSQRTSDKPLGLMEIMLLLDKQAEKARAESREFSSQREREAQLAHERQLQLIQTDNLRRDAEIKADRERIDREAKEERERNREFMATLMRLKDDAQRHENPDGAVKLLLSGIQLARDLGGGNGEEDPVNSLVQKLPEILSEGRRLFEAENNPKSKKSGEESVTFEGELAAKVKKLAERIQSQGKDPGTILGRAFDVLAGSYAAKSKASQKTAPKKTKSRLSPRNVTKIYKSAKKET